VAKIPEDAQWLHRRVRQLWFAGGKAVPHISKFTNLRTLCIGESFMETISPIVETCCTNLTKLAVRDNPENDPCALPWTGRLPRLPLLNTLCVLLYDGDDNIVTDIGNLASIYPLLTHLELDGCAFKISGTLRLSTLKCNIKAFTHMESADNFADVLTLDDEYEPANRQYSIAPFRCRTLVLDEPRAIPREVAKRAEVLEIRPCHLMPNMKDPHDTIKALLPVEILNIRMNLRYCALDVYNIGERGFTSPSDLPSDIRMTLIARSNLDGAPGNLEVVMVRHPWNPRLMIKAPMAPAS
jgi:hypothetical protein